MSVQARAVRQVSLAPAGVPATRGQNAALFTPIGSDFLSGGVISLIAWSQLVQHA